MEELMKVFDIPGVDSSDEKLRQLSGYMEGILDFNESINLTAITDRKTNYVKSSDFQKNALNFEN